MLKYFPICQKKKKIKASPDLHLLATLSSPLFMNESFAFAVSVFIWQTWHQRLLSPSGNTFCPQFLRPSLSSCFSDCSSISSASISLIDHSWWYPRFSYVSSPPFSLYILSGLVHPLSSCQLPFIWGLLPEQNLQHRSPFTAPDQYT